MKSYRKLCLAVVVLFTLIVAASNYVLFQQRTKADKTYNVQMNRAVREIEEKGIESLDLNQYPLIVSIETKNLYENNEELYRIYEVDGNLYRFNYTIPEENHSVVYIVNGILAITGLFIVLGMFYLYKKIIRPFYQIQNMPYALAKGNLTQPLRAQKDDYFGKFLWGMDMLREKLESQKKAQLFLQKEKNSLVLSLTHDIKTPLSAILLYVQALQRNLYKDVSKKTEILDKIHKNALSIESYVKQISQANQEDFLHLEVHKGEFYLDDLLDKVKEYYKEKLSLLKIDFEIENGNNCLLKGDIQRAEEVMQNVIENAIKYGHGGKITIANSKEDECHLIRIQNEKSSIQPRDVVHVFDSFWRGENSENISGSGLGLYICRKLMEAMGGEIFAQSENDCFVVTLIFSMA